MRAARSRTPAHSGGHGCRQRRRAGHRRLPSVRAHPAVQLGTALVLLIYVLLGGMPPPVPAADQGTVEICTARGLRVVPAADLPSSVPSAKPTRDCPLCLVHAAFLPPPAPGSGQVAAADTAFVVRSEPAAPIAGLFPGFDHLSRAPPLVC